MNRNIVDLSTLNTYINAVGGITEIRDVLRLVYGQEAKYLSFSLDYDSNDEGGVTAYICSYYVYDSNFNELEIDVEALNVDTTLEKISYYTYSSPKKIDESTGKGYLKYYIRDRIDLDSIDYDAYLILDCKDPSVRLVDVSMMELRLLREVLTKHGISHSYLDGLLQYE